MKITFSLPGFQMKGFADRLRRARMTAGLTQEQLGFEVEVTKSSVSAWENGRDTPSFKVLPQLRDALGCTLDYLVCGTTADSDVSTMPELPISDITARNSLERHLLVLYRTLPVRRRKALLEFIDEHR